MDTINKCKDILIKYEDIIFAYIFGSNINHLDLTGFNTSKVKDMESLFTSGNFGKLDLSMFDTSNVVNMAHMFYGTTLESLNISSFNTKSLTMVLVYRYGH